jgi:hypothetical protein
MISLDRTTEDNGQTHFGVGFDAVFALYTAWLADMMSN